MRVTAVPVRRAAHASRSHVLHRRLRSDGRLVLAHNILHRVAQAAKEDEHRRLLECPRMEGAEGVRGRSEQRRVRRARRRSSIAHSRNELSAVVPSVLRRSNDEEQRLETTTPVDRRRGEGNVHPVSITDDAMPPSRVSRAKRMRERALARRRRLVEDDTNTGVELLSAASIQRSSRRRPVVSALRE